MEEDGGRESSLVNLWFVDQEEDNMVEDVLVISAIRSLLIADETVTASVPASRILAAQTPISDDETFKVPMITIDCEIDESDPGVGATNGAAAVILWRRVDSTRSGDLELFTNLVDVLDTLLNKQVENLSAYDASLDIHKFRRVGKSTDRLEDIDCWVSTLEYDIVMAES
jgi:hypothetical protein